MALKLLAHLRKGLALEGRKLLKRKLVLATIALAGSAAAYGQAGFGTLTGTVTDPTQAVVANAQVILTLPNGEKRTTTTNGAGVYLFTALPPGAGYSETVTLSGFEASNVKNLSVSVGTTLSQNVSLQPGAESQSVTVSTANIEQVQTETSSVSQLIDSSIWKDSPLEDRSQNNFITLVAGAAPDNTTGRGAAVSGARTGTGNFLVEGMDNNDQGQGGSGVTYGTGGAVTTISPDAIDEYRVITHNPSAEYGRAGGFSTDTALKSGTNKFHGALFEYNRIQALDANSWFSNYAGQQDHKVRNQFGGAVGGPIWKDKTFFFATVEFHRFRNSAPLTGTSTTQAFLDFVDSGAFETFQETDPAGVCMQYTGAGCPGAFSDSAHLGPIFKQLLAAEPHGFPLATQQLSNAAQGLYTGGSVTYPVPIYGLATVNQDIQTNQERASFKLDHKLRDSDQISATYLLDFETSIEPYAGGGGTFGPDLNQIGGSQLFTISETHTFSPTLQNVFRAGYTRHVSNFAVPGTDGVPEIATANDPLVASLGSSSGLPQFFTDNEFLYEDSLSKTVRSHDMKTGFRFVRTRNGSSFYNDAKGTLLPWDTETLVTDETFDDQADRVLSGGPTYGSLYEATASIDTTTNQVPDVYRGYRANEFAAYFQDDWKVNKKLTLNLGVRWDYFGPPHNFRPGFDSNVYFGAFAAPTPNGNPFLPNTAITGATQGATFIQKNTGIWNKDTNNFGPRLGFAYDPTGQGTTAIRGGFGIGYDRLYNNVYENIRFNSPRFADNSIGALVNGVVAGALEQPALINVPFTANSLFAAYGGKPVPRHIDQRLVTAYYEQANFGIEQQLAKGYVFELNYIGTFGRKLVGLRDLNNYDGRVACIPDSTTGLASAACASAGFPNGFTSHRPSLLFNSDNFRSNGFSSNYNGLQASVRKGFSNGLMFLANYTWSKAMDETSDVFSAKTGFTGITDPINPGYDYGPADFDVRNLASITMNYEPPYKPRNLILGGWGISPIISLASGTPFSVVDTESTYDPNKDGREVDRGVFIGPGSLNAAVHRNTSPGPNGSGMLSISSFSGGDHGSTQPAAFVCPAGVNMGLWCDAPAQRNSFFGPHNTNVDLGISKRFKLFEGQQVVFQASFFNLFNHANFANPNADLNNASEFGISESTNNDPRLTQLSLRYEF
jgi:hypothetical protein